MIVSFSVSNFRSFRSEETLSLIASNRVAGDHEDHAIAIPDSKEKVLRTAVLYGANGAGKSNLFKALQYVESLVLETRPKGKGTGREPFRLNENGEKPSSFDLQFIASNKLFRFGMKVEDEKIAEEWLSQIVGNREKVLYERLTRSDGSVVIELDALKSAGPKLQALATVGGPQNQSFLATVNANLEEGEIPEGIQEVLNWFTDSLTLIAPDTFFGRLGHYLDENREFQEFASAFLKASSTGVDRLSVTKEELSREELRSLLPASVVSKVLKDVDEDRVGLIRIDDGHELMIERKGEDHFYRFSIQAVHEHKSGKVVNLDLDDESDGTRRLLNLLPALFRLRNREAVYFIDEIDRSLHPILVREFVHFFLKSCNSGLRQILVTTHESNLLDLDLLRRDEIWFVEKDNSAATRLYSLLEFKVRNDLEIRKHYLQGRFGAIPFLGSLDQLIGRVDQIR